MSIKCPPVWWAFLFMGRENNCSFCNPDINNQPHFARYGKERLDLYSILQTKDFVVFPDLLPVSPDGIHLLVAPKTHGNSLAVLTNLSEELGQVIRMAEETTGIPLVFFEHGATKDGEKIQSIYHQHGHLINSAGFNVIHYLSDWLDQIQIMHRIIRTPDKSPIVNLQHLFKNTDYLYVQQGRLGIIAHDDNNSFPSQITQKSMSQLLNGIVLDWKQIPNNEDLAKLSVQRIAQLIELCRKEVTHEIKKV